MVEHQLRDRGLQSVRRDFTRHLRLDVAQRNHQSVRPPMMEAFQLAATGTVLVVAFGYILLLFQHWP